MRRAIDPEIGREGALRREAAVIHDDARTRAERTRVGNGVERERVRDADETTVDVRGDEEHETTRRRSFLRR
jgi:hypothetical protein